MYRFDDFELDTQLFELRHKGKPRHLEPQVFNLLAYLVQHHDRVVTKEEVLEEVWGTQFITEATLSSRMMAARKALGDDGQTQQYIKTLRGRGFRFVGKIEEREPPAAPMTPEPGQTNPSSAAGVLASPAQVTPMREAGTLVGRENEIERLQRHFEQTQNATRRMIFVTGEAGAGKTTLVSTFLATVQRNGAARIACGQCLEQRSAGEAYMPLLDALDRLCRQSDGDAIIALLRKCAPTWLAQMPWLLSTSQAQELEAVVRGATRDRMLREMVQTLEAISESQPLVLVLEDLHWSDAPTLDLLSYLARRNVPAKLLVLATFRPTDLTLDHLLRTTLHELRIRGLCSELALPYLDTDAVQEYLTSRFGHASFPDHVATTLHERTAGNPLFMRNVLDAWLAHNFLVETETGWQLQASSEELAKQIPEDLHQLIEQQLAQLDAATLELVEAGSVAGMEFSSAAICDQSGIMAEHTEEVLLLLAKRGQFIEERRVSEWPDGTLSTHFGFTHHLYQEVLYNRIAPMRRARLHSTIGARLEAAYGARAREIAPRLADHFVQARDARAVKYLQLAAEQALGRSAYHDAAAQYSQALQILLRQEENRERAYSEMKLQGALGSALIATEGWGSVAASRALERARDLALQLNDAQHLATANYGLASQLEFRGEFVETQKLMEERLQLLRDLEDNLETPEPFVETHDLLACSFFHQGLFSEAVQHADKAIERYDPERHNDDVASIGENLGVASHYWAALALWYLGHADTALQRMGASLALAQTPDRAYCLASALTQSAMLHQLRGEPEKVLQQAQASIDLAAEKGFPYRVATGTILRGWALATRDADSDGVALIQQGIAICRASGVVLDDPYYLALLTEALAATGNQEQALSTLEEAILLVDNGRTFYHEAELHRLKGALLSQLGAKTAEAENHLKQALAVAQRQQSKPLELRALTELNRLKPTAATRRTLQKVLDSSRKD